MKRFRFNLQAVQVLRQRQEKTALQEYAVAVAAQRAAVDKLAAAKADCVAAWAASRAQLVAGATAADIVAMKNFCRVREEFQKTCDADLRDAQKNLDVMWKRLVVARQRREAVDKFYQRQRRDYDRACERETEKLLDELANRGAFTGVALNVNALEEQTLS